MYETLVGFVPFDGADVYSISTKHLTETPATPADVDSRIPAGLSSIVMRCLAKDPARRYARGNDLADALVRFLGMQSGTPAERRAGWLARTFPALTGSLSCI
jgi:serine/threonine-protein kinase